MISATNPFFALSYANIASLFGAAAASPSGVTATIGTSSTTSLSNTNDPAKTIRAILAKAQLDKAPAATANASGVSSTVESAYAAQIVPPNGAASAQASSLASNPSSADVETGANLDETKAQLVETEAIFSSLSRADPWRPLTTTAFVAQAATTDTATDAHVQFGSGQPATASGPASSTLTATVSSDQATSAISMFSVSGANSAGISLVRGASLVVATTDGISEIGVGTSNAIKASTEMATSALGTYQADISDESQADPNQKYLRVTITDYDTSAHDDEVIQSQAQKLLSAFKDSQLASPSSKMTGFAYDANDKSDCYSISAHVVDNNDLTYSIMTDTSSYDTQEKPALGELNAMSVANGTIMMCGRGASLSEWLIPIAS